MTDINNQEYSLANLPFTEENDIKRLERNKEVLDDLVDVLTKGGVPERSGDVRVLKEVIELSSKLTWDEINHRKNSKADENDAAIKASAIAIIRENMKNRKITKDKRLELEDAYIPTDIVPGETDITPEPLQIDDFVKNNLGDNDNV